MSVVSFIKGLGSNVKNKPIKDGQILFYKDSREMFLDISDQDRIQITDVIYLQTDEDREAILAPIRKFYYVLSKDELWVYNNRWLKVTNGVATDLVLGLVKSSNLKNMIFVHEDGTMEVNRIDDGFVG